MSQDECCRDLLSLMKDLRYEPVTMSLSDRSRMWVVVKRVNIAEENFDTAATLDKKLQNQKEHGQDKNIASIKCPQCGIVIKFRQTMPKSELIKLDEKISQLMLAALESGKSQDVGEVSNKGSLDRQQKYVDLLHDRYYTIVIPIKPTEFEENNGLYTSVHNSLENRNYEAGKSFCYIKLNQLLMRPRAKNTDLYISNYLEMLAFTYRKRNQYNEAIVLLSKILDIYKVVLGDNPFFALSNFTLAHTQNNLGICHAKVGNYSEALALFQSALPMMQQNREEVWIARQFGYLGALHHMQDQYSSAEGYYLEALRHHRLLPQRKEQDIKEIMQNLTICYLEQGKVKEAEDLQKSY